MKKQFSLVFFAWFAACFLGALPFYFSGFFPNFTGAFFESVSGFTTTGATVLADIETLPAWLLLYRAAIQWLGGIGILATAAIFPLFAPEGSGFRRKEKQILGNILLLYAALTALQFILLAVFGMDWFSALTCSFSTVSTGGFSIRNGGIAAYNSAATEWICACFMFLAGLNFFLIWMFFRKKARDVMRNSEARAYAGIVLAGTVIIAAAILKQSVSFAESLRQSFFQVVSVISTTGFYSANYTLWHYAAQAVLFLLLFVGGCSGCAAGGVKIIRCVVLSKQTWTEMKRIIYPHGVFNIQLNGESGNKKAVHGIIGFVFLYFLIAFFASLLVSSSGADVFASINTALLCQGNVGLGMGSAGAVNSFIDFPNYVKWGLCFVMLTGRLELWTVLVLFSKDFWRR